MRTALRWAPLECRLGARVSLTEKFLALGAGKLEQQSLSVGPT